MSRLKNKLKHNRIFEQPGYFPPITPRERSLIHRAVNGNDSEEMRILAACATLSRSLATFTPFSFELEEDIVRIIQGESVIAFPRPIPSVKFTLLVYGYLRWLERKYTLPGFCEVEVGDNVIDCGAYVGGFGLSIEDKASRIDFFEPASDNYNCLQLNIREFANTFAHPTGLYSDSGTKKFNISESSVEHSFLTPDHGATDESVEVDIVRLDSFAWEKGIKQIDFLKIEAEGSEIEVYQGVGDLPVKKIAVDVSPERDGKSPSEYLKRTLASKGYEVRIRENVLFGKRREE